MFFEKFSDKDLEPRSEEATLYEKGEYEVELSKLKYRKSDKSSAEYITVELAPLAKFENVDEIIIANEVNGSRIFNNYVFIKSDGSINETGSRMFIQLLSAVTGETNAEELRNRFDGESIEDVAAKASICASLKFRAYIGQRQEKDLAGQPIMRNTIGSVRSLNEAELDAIENSSIPGENGGVPF